MVWFGKKVVSPCFECLDHLIQLRQHRYQHNRNVFERSVMLNSTTHLKAIHHWHNEISDDEIRLVQVRSLESFLAIGGNCDLITIFLEQIL